jgi:2-polyprenyl-3-methyl-5-hydroxy-6-metoxy-1,4-benzoquinol methylase
VIHVCKVCGGVGSVLHPILRIKQTTEYLKCRKCGCVFSKIIASEAELASYYDTYYSSENLKIPEHIRLSISKTVSTFSKFRSSENKLCDLGYGAGALLEIAEIDGWNCSGSEYSPDAIEIGKIRGWDVHQGELEIDDLPGPFDVITIVETLEHVQDPNDLISKASIRLRQGGLIYGTTPNGKSLNSFLLGTKWSVFSFPEHPILMSKKSIEILLVANGFTNIRVYSQGLNPHDLFREIKRLLSKESHSQSETSRVQYGYDLVQLFSANIFLTMFKKTVNYVLSLAGIGDTLVFRAVKK